MTETDRSRFREAMQGLGSAVAAAAAQASRPGSLDQHAEIDQALAVVTALRSLPDLRVGALSRIILAEEQLKRLRDLCPRFPSHPVYCETEQAERCERGCRMD